LSAGLRPGPPSAGLRPTSPSAVLRPGPLSAGLRPGPGAGPWPTTRHPQPDRRGQDLSPRWLCRRCGRGQGDGRRTLLDDGRALLDGGRRRSRVIGDDRGHRRAGGHHGSDAFWLPDRIPPGGIPGRIPPVILPARDRSLPLRRPALGRHGTAGWPAAVAVLVHAASRRRGLSGIANSRAHGPGAYQPKSSVASHVLRSAAARSAREQTGTYIMEPIAVRGPSDRRYRGRAGERLVS
jgi:hypothetical protein